MTRPEFVLPEHHGVQLHWAAEVPTELRVLFRPYAEWMARFAPRWLQHLHLDVRDDASGAALHVIVDTEYNKATVSLYMGWIAQPIPKRNEDVAHELVHLYTAPIDAAVCHIRAEEKPELAKLHGRLYKQGDESATVSLARLLVAHLPPVALADTTSKC